jgi:hypothetical protein
MPDIYGQHRAAFSSVSAYVVLHEGKMVATVAFKYPRDGAGRLYCYLHVLGTAMVRGWASGGGYDKESAAFCACLSKLPNDAPHCESFKYVRDNGYGWGLELKARGYKVLQAV